MELNNKIFEILKDLVALDTTSRNSNLPVIEYIENYLDDYNIKTRRIWYEEGNKSNLHAIIGPPQKHGLALSAHTDVVPVDGQNWTSDPWILTQREDKLFGRGTADMKGFIAGTLAMIPTFKKANLERPLHLIFSPDEEIGCLGIIPLIEELIDSPNKPDYVIVGEPTSLQIVLSHKEHFTFRCSVTGIENHSSLAPEAVNAVEYASRLITKITEIARRKADTGPYDSEFHIPYTTLHTGLVRGGTAVNIVPKHANFEFEIRAIPLENSKEIVEEIRDFINNRLVPEMKSVYKNASIELDLISNTPGLDTSPTEMIVNEVKNLTTDIGPNAHGKVSYATEAGLFQKAGFPTVICGPGSIEQAHGPDEYITIAQLNLLEQFLSRINMYLQERSMQ
ncbi:MAG: acetylornithine deacetylase [Chloroflexi bacterium]|nr:acetylornithine deacetylase [Chloroflexota bacterium]|tara:strand:- start:1636 stop:2817 length:1182 start_codon:yes stop_codon:yes gene_type:complete